MKAPLVLCMSPRHTEAEKELLRMAELERSHMGIIAQPVLLLSDIHVHSTAIIDLDPAKIAITASELYYTLRKEEMQFIHPYFRGEYIYQHKGKKPKRGNPWRRMFRH